LASALLFQVVMRVYVSSPDAAISPQMLAYAEYRVFAVLARYDGVRGARVILRQAGDGAVRCTVMIDFDAAASARAGATGPNAAGTIDRAAERVVQLMRRRFQPEIAHLSN
jgi:antibiotic biosynthesis monooxygenase (ABM) superfamily enzyme